MRQLVVVGLLCVMVGCGISPERIDNLKGRVQSLGVIADQAQMTGSQRTRLRIHVEQLCDDLEDLK